MSRSIFLLAVLLAAGSYASDVPFENSGVVGHLPDQLVITLQPGVKLNVDKSLGLPLTGRPELDALAVKHGVTGLEPLYGPLIEAFDDPKIRELLASVYTVDFNPDAGLKNVLDDYAQLALVSETHPVPICRSSSGAFLPNDLSGSQWYLRNPSLGSADIRVLGGWAESLGDSSVIVAIPDSGIDWLHPDLGGPHPDKVNGALWTNWSEYHGTPGTDNDGNGYVDDIRGWDFVSNVTHPTYDCHPDEDCLGVDNDPMDFGGHGTNCAGIVGAITDNSLGIAGTAPGVKIMGLRVGWTTSDGNGLVLGTYCAQAMVYAAANGAKIVNCSWGNTSILSSAVTTCLNAGMLIFESAGNDNDEIPSYLGNYNDPQRRVLSVAATTTADTKASFSSYGTWVDISAPGVQMYTTHYNYNTGQSGYVTTQGTSFSSPLTAGAAALIWSAQPGLTAAQVSSVLRDSCDDLDALNPPYAGKLGAGRVNLLRALGDDVQEVPGEFLQLRDAVHCAAAGDTIKVRSDHLESVVTLLGKGLHIKGGYAPDYLARDPLGSPSVITGNSLEPAVRFSGTVTTSTVLDGFRLQNGGGSIFATPYVGRYGGGLLLSISSPTLRNLTFSGNAVGSSTELGAGGGLALINTQAVLENVIVEGNTGIRGAGIFIYGGSPTLTDVAITGNTLLTSNAGNPPRGGGLHIVDAQVTLTNVTIDGHLEADQGGGLYATTLSTPPVLTITGGSISGNTAKSQGGGLYLGGGTLTATDLLVSGNAPTASATFMNGGGLYAQATSLDLTGVVLTGNTAHIGGGLQATSCPEVVIASSLATGNEGLFLGGGLHFATCTTAELTGLTIADNHCASGSAGLYADGTPLTVSNTISAFNTGGTGLANGIHAVNAAATLLCNNVFGNDGSAYGGVADPTGADGNVALDPLFCDRGEGDYQLESGSPCAADHSGGCGLIGALGVGCDTASGVDEPAVPLVFAVEANFPNPFNPATTIRFATPAAARTTAVVYDLKGRLVKTLLDEELPAGDHAVLWQGDDDQGRTVPAGIYFYRVSSGENAAVGRMALIK